MRGLFYALAFLVGWATSYASGAWPWIGYASMTRSTFGAGPITIIGENRRGIDVGLENFCFFKGQEIVIDYDAEIRAGSLWFHVYRPFDGVLGDGPSLYITENAKGEWTVPIEATGYYHITIDGSPTKGRGRGYDISYTVKWGARTPVEAPPR